MCTRQALTGDGRPGTARSSGSCCINAVTQSSSFVANAAWARVQGVIVVDESDASNVQFWQQHNAQVLAMAQSGASKVSNAHLSHQHLRPEQGSPADYAGLCAVCLIEIAAAHIVSAFGCSLPCLLRKQPTTKLDAAWRGQALGPSHHAML